MTPMLKSIVAIRVFLKSNRTIPAKPNKITNPKGYKGRAINLIKTAIFVNLLI